MVNEAIPVHSDKFVIFHISRDNFAGVHNPLKWAKSQIVLVKGNVGGTRQAIVVITLISALEFSFTSQLRDSNWLLSKTITLSRFCSNLFGVLEFIAVYCRAFV